MWTEVYNPRFSTCIVNIKDGNMEREDGPDELHRIVVVEVLKKKKGVTS